MRHEAGKDGTSVDGQGEEIEGVPMGFGASPASLGLALMAKPSKRPARGRRGG